MRIKRIVILILFSIILHGCEPLTENHNSDQRQVKVTEFANQNLNEFSPIFFKGETVLVQQREGVPKTLMGTALYSSNNLKEYNKITSFKNHFGQFYANPRNSEEVFFVSEVGEGGTEQIVFKSSDQGDTWQQVYNDSADDLTLANLVFHPSNTGELFLVKNDKIQGIEIIKSNDSGIHWSKLSATKQITMAYQLVIDAKNSKHFLIAAVNGLWESLDGGFSWKAIIGSESKMAIFDPVENDKAYFITIYSNDERCIYELDNGKIKRISIPNALELIDGVGIAYQTSTNKIFTMVISYNEEDSNYNTAIYQLNADSLTPITQIKSKDRTLEEIFFDSTNPNVVYIYNYKSIYKVDL
ncbi:MAG: hypothetical protein IBX64_13150 [Actinobacteria bacterium]|nr:hypothetical protein [Actinomycetota bacterium]